jgi:hypothetical protein
MSRDFDKNENAKSDPKKQGSYYKVCTQHYDVKERQYVGCGKLYTMDSVTTLCKCGEILSAVKLAEIPPVIHRVHMEKCLTCAFTDSAPACMAGSPKEQCRECHCAACCSRAKEIADTATQKSGLKFVFDLGKKAYSV